MSTGNINKKLYKNENIDNKHFNVSLDGYDMIMEELTPNESFNRRETIRHNILGGTQSVMRGNYLPRDYTFTTHLIIDADNPDVYDSVLREWQSKPVEVSSKFMGGKFKAEIIIKKSPTGMPNFLGLEVQVIEIPESKSLIPNESIVIPKKPKKNVTITSTKNKSSKSSKKSNSKKSNSKKSSKKNNKKGSKITKTKNSKKSSSSKKKKK